MDKEDVVCVCVCVYIYIYSPYIYTYIYTQWNNINHKKKLTWSFIVMWINLESVILNEVRKGKANIVYYPI